MILTIFGNLTQQSKRNREAQPARSGLIAHPITVMPNFCLQRDLYEARERPSKTYSWRVFMLSSIIVVR